MGITRLVWLLTAVVLECMTFDMQLENYAAALQVLIPAEVKVAMLPVRLKHANSPAMADNKTNLGLITIYILA